MARNYNNRDEYRSPYFDRNHPTGYFPQEEERYNVRNRNRYEPEFRRYEPENEGFFNRIGRGIRNAWDDITGSERQEFEDRNYGGYRERNAGRGYYPENYQDDRYPGYAGRRPFSNEYAERGRNTDRNWQGGRVNQGSYTPQREFGNNYGYAPRGGYSEDRDYDAYSRGNEDYPYEYRRNRNWQGGATEMRSEAGGYGRNAGGAGRQSYRWRDYDYDY